MEVLAFGDCVSSINYSRLVFYIFVEFVWQKWSEFHRWFEYGLSNIIIKLFIYWYFRSAGAIAGIVVGCILGVALLIGSIILCCCCCACCGRTQRRAPGQIIQQPGGAAITTISTSHMGEFLFFLMLSQWFLCYVWISIKHNWDGVKINYNKDKWKHVHVKNLFFIM